MAVKTVHQMLNLPAAQDGDFFHADWPAPPTVHTLLTTRRGGVGSKPFDSLNLGSHVGDYPENVAANRARVEQTVGRPVIYLNQIHSTDVVYADCAHNGHTADASINSDGLAACAVMTADCLPVLFCDEDGTTVAAAHAGWRGLAGGIVQNTADAMRVPPEKLLAYLGPAIGPEAFEVGQDVWDAFCLPDPGAADAFDPIGEGKYLADIYRLACRILRRHGINRIYGGNRCTVLERDHFFSYRRDGRTGRMASIIWLETSH
ncbi:peptidoglycan editing factor PgeF [Neisseria leonii]|uniref:peptidoglycan editing factor PgeF n=1 Tax=Neisseria leonii TaxID=2995413 RepID=UPI0030CFE4FE